MEPISGSIAASANVSHRTPPHWRMTELQIKENGWNNSDFPNKRSISLPDSENMCILLQCKMYLLSKHLTENITSPIVHNFIVFVAQGLLRSFLGYILQVTQNRSLPPTPGLATFLDFHTGCVCQHDTNLDNIQEERIFTKKTPS